LLGRILADPTITAMQQRDQARLGQVFDAEFRCDPCADLTGRARQGLGDPRSLVIQSVRPRTAAAVFVTETRQAPDPIFLVQLVPGADDVVVDEQNLGHGFAAYGVVEQHKGIRSTGKPMRCRPVTGQLDQVAARYSIREAGGIVGQNRIDVRAVGKGFVGLPKRRGII